MTIGRIRNHVYQVGNEWRYRVFSSLNDVVRAGYGGKTQTQARSAVKKERADYELEIKEAAMGKVRRHKKGEQIPRYAVKCYRGFNNTWSVRVLNLFGESIFEAANFKTRDQAKAAGRSAKDAHLIQIKTKPNETKFTHADVQPQRPRTGVRTGGGGCATPFALPVDRHGELVWGGITGPSHGQH